MDLQVILIKLWLRTHKLPEEKALTWIELYASHYRTLVNRLEKNS